MGVAIALGAAAVAAGAGKVIGGILQKKGNKRAVQALTDSLNSLKAIDIGATVNLADQRDIQKYAQQFEVQRKYDPLMAEARDKSAAKLVEGLADDPQANALLKALQDDALKDSPERQAIIDQLFSGAKKELDAGAKLPPEFQQELIRSGLEKTSGAGVAGDYRGAAGATQRELLGQAGINLKAFRQDQVGKALTMADELKTRRAAILSNASNQTENVAANRQARAINAFNTADSSVPSIGLSGVDVAKMSLQNVAFENWREWTKGQARAGLSSGNAKIDGDAAVAIGDTVGSVISGAAGAPGGGSTLNKIEMMGYQAPNNYFALTPNQQNDYASMLERAKKQKGLFE